MQRPLSAHRRTPLSPVPPPAVPGKLPRWCSGNRADAAAILILEKFEKSLPFYPKIVSYGEMKYLNDCIAHIRQSAGAAFDRRTGKNIQYSMSDIVMAPFAMFFMQSPSFLAFQRALKKRFNNDNTCTLFGMNKIPTDNHIRTTLDAVDPNFLDDEFFYIIDNLPSYGKTITHQSLGNHTLIAFDGTEYFTSKNMHCDSCSHRVRSSGETEYFHSFLCTSIVKPGTKSAYCLPTEFIVPQDGTKKNDCEWRAVNRWLERVGPKCSKYNPIYLGDDLYSKHEICSKIKNINADFIFTCKDSSHKTLSEFRNGLKLTTYSEIRGTGSQRREYHYSFVTNLPIRDGEDAIDVNWFELTISLPHGRQKYHGSFITSITPTLENIVELGDCARARWKIENETFNVLKNNGYHLEHNFGHGKNALSSVLVTLNLLAFSLHNTTHEAERLWQEARSSSGTRNQFFNVLGSLTLFTVFLTWRSLMITIITGQQPTPP